MTLAEGAFQDFIRHGGQPVPVRAVGNNIHFTLQPEKLPSRVRIGGFQNGLRIVIIMAVQTFEQGGQVFTDFRLFADVNLPVIRGDVYKRQLLSLAACTGMLACPGAWATAVCQEQSYHLKTACPHRCV